MESMIERVAGAIADEVARQTSGSGVTLVRHAGGVVVATRGQFEAADVARAAIGAMTPDMVGDEFATPEGEVWVRKSAVARLAPAIYAAMIPDLAAQEIVQIEDLDGSPNSSQ